LTPVTEANRLAQEILVNRLEMLKMYKNTPPGAVFASLKTRRAVVWCRPEDSVGDDRHWQWEHYSKSRAEGEDAILLLNFGEMAEALKDRIATCGSQRGEEEE